MKAKCVLSTVDGDGLRHETSSEGEDLTNAIGDAAEMLAYAHYPPMLVVMAKVVCLLDDGERDDLDREFIQASARYIRRCSARKYQQQEALRKEETPQ